MNPIRSLNRPVETGEIILIIILNNNYSSYYYINPFTVIKLSSCSVISRTRREREIEKKYNI